MQPVGQVEGAEQRLQGVAAASNNGSSRTMAAGSNGASEHFHCCCALLWRGKRPHFDMFAADLL